DYQRAPTKMTMHDLFRSNLLKQDHSMEGPGQRLKTIRERLNLTMRDVENDSQTIAERRKSLEYRISLSRLFDIESNGVIPSIYRIYALCAIYRLDFHVVLNWYGVRLETLTADAMAVDLAATHPIQFNPNDGDVNVPLSLEPGLDLNKTT